MEVQMGQEILLEYTLSTEDELLESSPPGNPLALKLGEGRLHPALESQIVGKSPGQEFTVGLDASLAFGERLEELCFKVSRKKLPESLRDLSVGEGFQAPDSKGKPKFFRVIGADENRVEVDGNHPLAGMPLELRAKILKVISSEEQPKAHCQDASDESARKSSTPRP